MGSYKFFFVLMYMTGVTKINGDFKITENEALNKKSLKDFLDDLEIFKSKLADEKDRVFGKNLKKLNLKPR